jgi:hypothetical protein
MARIHAAAADRAASELAAILGKSCPATSGRTPAAHQKQEGGERWGRSNFRADRYIAAAPLFVKAVE